MAMSSVPANKNAIDLLKKVANLTPKRKVVVLNDGTEFPFWHKPLTMAQRDKARESAKDDAVTSMALKLVIELCQDEHGQKLFTPGDESDLRHFVRDSDLQKIMVELMSEKDGDEPPTAKVATAQDPKSPAGTV